MARTVRPVPRTTQAAIRRYRRSDLPMLEWDGLFADQRELIAHAFRRQEQGENLFTRKIVLRRKRLLKF